MLADDLMESGSFGLSAAVRAREDQGCAVPRGDPHRGGDLVVSFAVASSAGGGPGRAEVAIFDVSGRLLKRLVDDVVDRVSTKPPGTGAIVPATPWRGGRTSYARGPAGRSLGSRSSRCGSSVGVLKMQAKELRRSSQEAQRAADAHEMNIRVAALTELIRYKSRDIEDKRRESEELAAKVPRDAPAAAIASFEARRQLNAAAIESLESDVRTHIEELDALQRRYRHIDRQEIA